MAILITSNSNEYCHLYRLSSEHFLKALTLLPCQFPTEIRHKVQNKRNRNLWLYLKTKNQDASFARQCINSHSQNQVSVHITFQSFLHLNTVTDGWHLWMSEENMTVSVSLCAHTKRKKKNPFSALNQRDLGSRHVWFASCQFTISRTSGFEEDFCLLTYGSKIPNTTHLQSTNLQWTHKQSSCCEFRWNQSRWWRRFRQMGLLWKKKQKVCRKPKLKWLWSTVGLQLQNESMWYYWDNRNPSTLIKSGNKTMNWWGWQQ